MKGMIILGWILWRMIMARSEYIYLLQHLDGEIIGAWTVKHEMVTLLEKMVKAVRDLQHDYRVIRMRDGGNNRAAIIPWEDLL